MAFQMDFSIPAGVNVAFSQEDSTIKTLIRESKTLISNGYVKVGLLNGNKNGIEVIMEYRIRKEDMESIHNKSFLFTPSPAEDSPRWDKQVYEYLKTLPEFKNVVDC